VAAPIGWDELPGIDRADAITIATIAPRLEEAGRDPWKGYFRLRQKLPKIR
jgi:bifunctional non-homologous end joining protein LigD